MGDPDMDYPQRRHQATTPEAVLRLDLLTSDRPEHDLHAAQQLAAIRALLLAQVEVRP
jgi:hypothetical protein